ncbi:EAL domain-containing protein [Vibrio sp. nBUS_14]|uniref:EAL domain-containing protein n=1 Tax=Vibrio sp. nBUS_14 TaxID=3395321 RepID=UPI003EBAFAAD
MDGGVFLDCLIRKYDVESSIERVKGLYVAKYGGFYFESVFQPIVCSTGQYLGVEALVRIKNIITGESINPYCFFQSLKSDIDTTNFGTVCFGIHVRNFAQSSHHRLKLFINIPPVMFSTTYNHPTSIKDAIDRLRKEDLLLNDIVFEVTEFEDKHVSGLISGVDQFRRCGIHIAIDDFGVDFSNEERVRLLSPDYIKLDKSLLDNYMEHDDPTLVDAIAFSKNEGATVIVEGVETKEQADTLTNLGVEFMQGYYWGKPLSPHIPNLKS